MVIYRDCGVSFCDKLQQDCTCVYLEKKNQKGREKNVTRATNGFYREYFVSVCDKLQQDCIS